MAQLGILHLGENVAAAGAAAIIVLLRFPQDRALSDLLQQ